MAETAKIYFHGHSIFSTDDTPFISGIGYVIIIGGDKKHGCGIVGNVFSNSIASFMALKGALQDLSNYQEVSSENITIEIFSNDEQVIMNCAGMKKVNEPYLEVFHDTICSLTKKFKCVKYFVIPYNENKEARELADRIIDAEYQNKKTRF